MATPDRLTAAMEEAYASAPSNVVFLHTIQLDHPSFGGSIRLVVGDEGWPEERTNLVAYSGNLSGSGWNLTSGIETGHLLDSGLTASRRLTSSILKRAGVYNHTGLAWIVNASSTAWALDATGRHVVTFTTPAGCTAVRVYVNRNAANTGGDYYVATGLTPSVVYTFSFYTQDRSDGYTYFGGIQLEAGPVATRAVETSSSPVTLPANTVQLTLENGQVAPFTCMAFDILPPGFDEDGPTEGRIIVDGVSGMLLPYLEGAAGTAGTISVTYRNYRSDARFEPGEVITGLKMKSVQVSATRVEGTIGFDEVGAQAFPRVTYDLDQYPGLFTGQS